MWEWHFWLFCAPSEVYMCDEVSSYLKVLIKRYWIFFLFFFCFFWLYFIFTFKLNSSKGNDFVQLKMVSGGRGIKKVLHNICHQWGSMILDIWWYGKRELTKISFSREVRNEWPKTNCPTKWVEQTIEIYKVFYLNFCLHFKPH